MDQEEVLYEGAAHEVPLNCAAGFVLYKTLDEGYVASDLWAWSLIEEDARPIPVATNARAEERLGEISPDGLLVAFDSDVSGRTEVFVQDFPTPTRDVSVGGGSAPRWSKDGNALYFIAPDGTMMVSRVRRTESGFDEMESATPQFPTHIIGQTFNHQYAVTGDGRFLVVTREAAIAPPIVILQNWKP